MSWFTKALGAVGSLFGAGGGKTVEKTVDIVDKAFYTDQEKATDRASIIDVDQKDLASARAMQGTSWGTKFDIVIDGWSRVIRPAFTTWLFGGFAGWWNFPQSDSISPEWVNVGYIVLTFWFGGRAILKDLPEAIKAMRRG